MAVGLQARHDFGRQDDDVGGLAGPHQFRGFDAAHRADFDVGAFARLMVPNQIAQDVSGSH
jgi:hypothetical protein